MACTSSNKDHKVKDINIIVKCEGIPAPAPTPTPTRHYFGGNTSTSEGFSFNTSGGVQIVGITFQECITKGTWQHNGSIIVPNYS